MVQYLGLRNCSVILETREVYLFHSAQTASGIHPAPCLVGTSGSYPGVKWPNREGDCPPPASAHAKNRWNCTPLLHMP